MFGTHLQPSHWAPPASAAYHSKEDINVRKTQLTELNQFIQEVLGREFNTKTDVAFLTGDLNICGFLPNESNKVYNLRRQYDQKMIKHNPDFKEVMDLFYQEYDESVVKILG